MKKIFPIILVLFASSCRNLYELSNDNKDRKYLIEFIKQRKKEGLITRKPLLVLNGEMIPYDKLKECDLELYKSDIDSIYAFFKKEDKGAVYIYGNEAKNGVILIEVKKFNLNCK
ncbi:hypothetical protein [Pontimicrobium sp. IMCC45349]|uniref:hypothetical protein n=1 Tax=Pontimicrobium sp. IMCC45349 TaxID=3391574 RepID=UPI00399F7564